MSIEPVKLVTLTQLMTNVELGNKCKVVKGSVIDKEQRASIAFVKHLPPRAILIECLAALIARNIGLPAPRPMLVNVSPVKIPSLNLSQNSIFFGSEDVGFPSLAQITENRFIAHKLSSWPHLLTAGCFDEWIANSDRHTGNIIYDGGTFSLIDHSHAIQKGHHFDQPTDQNSFLEIARPKARNDLLTHNLRRKAEKAVREFKKLSTEDWRALTSYNLYCDENKAKEVIIFLKNRLDFLTQLIAQKLGDKQIDLYASSGYQ